ncbi:hypothetical protein L198_01190 [Cryptococcus wingfieldii CBS 7118]|uniref:AMP-activated protein kinase glycogen-binding domain-containing protein n=1 Tax=Cryptococcus wingfieldii CBS 7118 TaxID=1295528 RepID=A0A1E3K3J1_9TREE|nr:hypothetical protein L198_01190 [Cryptococcus wingfieldii CBS 7118]ODO07609.1 hypothetical protein L198_01190 [Cryptococcus wingfieldii CBS 7118]
MSDSYKVTFQWGAGAQTVCVAGNFNDWSATATPLHKQADGSFSASVPVPWGEKGAFKYVVDGEWKVREDEGKEWDAAGNMNNIYQAPESEAASSTAAPTSTATTGASPTDSKHSHSGAGTAVAAGAAGGTALGGAALHSRGKDSTTKDSTPLASSEKSVPSKSVDTTSPVTTTSEKSAVPVQETKTEPSNLLAANVPGSAVGAPLLGKPLTGSETSTTGGALPVASHTASENDKVVPIATTGTVPSPSTPSKAQDIPPSRLVADATPSKSTPTKDASTSSAVPAAAAATGASAATAASTKDVPSAKSTSTDPAVHTGAGVSPEAGKIDAVNPRTAAASDAPVDSKAATDKAGATADGEPKTLSPGPVPVVVPAPTAAAAISGPDATVVKTTDPAGGVVGTAPEATPKEIEQVAKHANIGEAPLAAPVAVAEGEEQHGITERAAEYGAAAIGAIGGALGGAVVAVEKATGVDIVHSSPLSVEEAKAKGIDVSTLNKVDGASDSTVPTGQAPPASAIAALDEKVDELKAEQGPSTTSTVGQGSAGVAAVPLPGGSVAPNTGESSLSANAAAFQPRKQHSIPAQPETIPDNHQSIPAPVFTTVSPKDPHKDRSLNASEGNKLQDTAGQKQVGDDPAVDAHEVKREAEAHPGGASSYGQTGQADVVGEGKPEVQAAKKSAAPDTPANNLGVGREGDASKLAPQSEGAGNATVSKAGEGAVAPGSDTEASGKKGVTEAATGAPTTSTAPSTPAKKTNGASTPSTPAAVGVATGTSTAASTPAKAAKTEDGQVNKKKSSFFSKIKHALKKDKK